MEHERLHKREGLKEATHARVETGVLGAEL